MGGSKDYDWMVSTVAFIAFLKTLIFGKEI